MFFLTRIVSYDKFAIRMRYTRPMILLKPPKEVGILPVMKVIMSR